VTGGWAAVTAVAQALGSLQVQVDDIGLRRPTLDEVFLTLTGAATRADGDRGRDHRGPAPAARREETG
jgi:ABC-2 type transport system ATP-binding protein